MSQIVVEQQLSKIHREQTIHEEPSPRHPNVGPDLSLPTRLPQLRSQGTFGQTTIHAPMNLAHIGQRMPEPKSKVPQHRARSKQSRYSRFRTVYRANLNHSPIKHEPYLPSSLPSFFFFPNVITYTRHPIPFHLSIYHVKCGMPQRG